MSCVMERKAKFGADMRRGGVRKGHEAGIAPVAAIRIVGHPRASVIRGWLRSWKLKKTGLASWVW